MALVVTKVRQEPTGGGSVYVTFDVVCSGVTTGTFKTGLKNIDAIQAENQTTASVGLALKNKSAVSTTELGSIFLSNYTSGDSVNITVRGR